MGGAVRHILHLTLPVLIIVSLWILAGAQEPPQDGVTIGKWVNSAGVTVTGNPYSREVVPFRFPEYQYDDDTPDEAEAAPKLPTAPQFADADADEF